MESVVEAEREVVLCASAGVESGSVVGVQEAEVKTTVVERGRRVEGECSEGCGDALKTILEAIEDLKMSFASEVNELKSVVKKQEIEIRSLKCGGEGPSGVRGGAHARDVPVGVPERDVTRATTKVTSKSPGIGVWKVVDHGARPKEKKVNNDHVVCTNPFQVLSGLQEGDVLLPDLWYSRAIALNCRLALHCKDNGWAFVDTWDLFFGITTSTAGMGCTFRGKEFILSEPLLKGGKHKDGGPPEALRMSYRRPDGSVRRRAAGNLLRGSPAGRSQRPARASGGLTEVNLPPAAAVRRSTAYVGPPVMLTCSGRLPTALAQVSEATNLWALGPPSTSLSDLSCRC
ncbi:hypothetical protein GWK47_034467 [Chionoecetes opilio]|uniref:Uncharacterized protein n=1 Tax=Chionoecetes opilio TaxID=41210 RepID=A0A8J5D0Q8_CHIOP|nr:hypothetical protein GWK47_034467 [Chionoecetes opilio]